jgi:hypothetical protein
MENYEYLSHEFADHAIPATLNVRILGPVVSILHDAQFICNTIGLKVYLNFAQQSHKDIPWILSIVYNWVMSEMFQNMALSSRFTCSLFVKAKYTEVSYILRAALNTRQ